MAIYIINSELFLFRSNYGSHDCRAEKPYCLLQKLLNNSKNRSQLPEFSLVYRTPLKNIQSYASFPILGVQDIHYGCYLCLDFDLKIVPSEEKAVHFTNFVFMDKPLDTTVALTPLDAFYTLSNILVNAMCRKLDFDLLSSIPYTDDYDLFLGDHRTKLQQITKYTKKEIALYLQPIKYGYIYTQWLLENFNSGIILPSKILQTSGARLLAELLFNPKVEACLDRNMDLLLTADVASLSAPHYLAYTFFALAKSCSSYSTYPEIYPKLRDFWLEHKFHLLELRDKMDTLSKIPNPKFIF